MKDIKGSGFVNQDLRNLIVDYLTCSNEDEDYEWLENAVERGGLYYALSQRAKKMDVVALVICRHIDTYNIRLDEKFARIKNASKNSSFRPA